MSSDPSIVADCWRVAASLDERRRLAPANFAKSSTKTSSLLIAAAQRSLTLVDARRRRGGWMSVRALAQVAVRLLGRRAADRAVAEGERARVTERQNQSRGDERRPAAKRVVAHYRAITHSPSARPLARPPSPRLAVVCARAAVGSNEAQAGHSVTRATCGDGGNGELRLAMVYSQTRCARDNKQ